MYAIAVSALLAALLAYWCNMTASPDTSLYLGVYRPVDPAMYSEFYPDNPDPRTKEVARLYTDLISLFIKMGYVDIQDFRFPPHKDPHINLFQPARYGFTKNVVDLYQMIPYKHSSAGTNWNHGSDAGEFLLGGEFLNDLTGANGDDGVWQQDIIDPFYGLDHDLWRDSDAGPDEPYPTSSWNAERGPYIRPEYAVLSNCGNHGSIMVLNTKNWHIWLIEQLGGSSDPVFRNQAYNDEECPNENDLRRYPSRPATEFFNDIIDRFEKLQWLPGGLYWPETQKEFTRMKEFYLTSGWPDNFDLEKFHALRVQAEQEDQEFRSVTSPLDELESLLRTQKEKARAAANLQTYEIEADAKIKEVQKRIERASLQDEIQGLQAELDNERTILERYREFAVGPSPAQWQAGQQAIRAKLEEHRAERQLMINREGRFSGTTDESYESMMRDDYYGDAMKNLEALLADENDVARSKRLEREIRYRAQAVPEEMRTRWEEEQVRWWGKDEQWLKGWQAWYEEARDLD